MSNIDSVFDWVCKNTDKVKVSKKEVILNELANRMGAVMDLLGEMSQCGLDELTSSEEFLKDGHGYTRVKTDLKNLQDNYYYWNDWIEKRRNK